MPDTDCLSTLNLSRRDMFGATAGLPLIGTQSAAGPTAETACRAWLAKAAEIERLLLMWGDAEARLATEFGWFTLSDPERHALPEGRVLKEIDRKVDGLVQARDTLLQSLPDLPAPSRAAIGLKVRVISHFLPAEDFPDARALILSVLRDLGDTSPHG